jgi:hypothetical protein
MAIEDTFIRGYRQLALETPTRPRDRVLRALDLVLSALFLVIALPVSLLLLFVLLATSGSATPSSALARISGRSSCGGRKTSSRRSASG